MPVISSAKVSASPSSRNARSMPSAGTQGTTNSGVSPCATGPRKPGTRSPPPPRPARARDARCRRPKFRRSKERVRPSWGLSRCRGLRLPGPSARISSARAVNPSTRANRDVSTHGRRFRKCEAFRGRRGRPGNSRRTAIEDAPPCCAAPQPAVSPSAWRRGPTPPDAPSHCRRAAPPRCGRSAGPRRTIRAS